MYCGKNRITSIVFFPFTILYMTRTCILFKFYQSYIRHTLSHIQNDQWHCYPFHFPLHSSGSFNKYLSQNAASWIGLILYTFNVNSDLGKLFAMYIVLRFPWWFLQWEWLIKKNKQSKFNIEGGKDNNLWGEKI